LGEIVRGTQICNLFGQIQPPDATEIKKILAAVRGKNPENLQILKLQYLDFPDSVSDDFFFQIGCFSERNSDIQPFLQIFHRNIPKTSRMSRPSFFFSEKKKSAKIKNICPQCLPKESALIPLVKNQILNTKAPQQIYKNNMQNLLYYYQTLRVGQHHTMDPIMEGILSCSLASSRGHPPIELPLQIQYFSSCLITLLEPLYIVLPSPKNILEEESSRSRTF
jgi:hypothetical protein